jgi:hypothetical protein
MVGGDRGGRWEGGRGEGMTDYTLSHSRPVVFTLEQAQKAADEWRFNCGPGALCAVLHKTPDEIRPHMMDFESKGYTNPTLMLDVLRGLNVPFKQVYRSDEPAGFPTVRLGLIRIQWGGPWTKPGVPMQARYRQTHWVAARNGSSEIFDVNAMCVGGWLSQAEWTLQLVPWLMKECCPKGDGLWATHAIEVWGNAEVAAHNSGKLGCVSRVDAR